MHTHMHKHMHSHTQGVKPPTQEDLATYQRWQQERKRGKVDMLALGAASNIVFLVCCCHTLLELKASTGLPPRSHTCRARTA